MPSLRDMMAIMLPTFPELLQNTQGKDMRLNAGALLFQRADPVRHVYLIRQGEVHLLRRQEDGTTSILQRAGPGTLLAEASLLSDSYHCAAEAVTESRLTYWPHAKIRALIYDDKSTALAFARHLANEVRAARLKAEITAHRRVCDRLDAWLTWHESGLPGKGEWHHLARELNVSPEALYREIARRNRHA